MFGQAIDTLGAIVPKVATLFIQPDSETTPPAPHTPLPC